MVKVSASAGELDRENRFVRRDHQHIANDACGDLVGMPVDHAVVPAFQRNRDNRRAGADVGNRRFVWHIADCVHALVGLAGISDAHSWGSA